MSATRGFSRIREQKKNGYNDEKYTRAHVHNAQHRE